MFYYVYYFLAMLMKLLTGFVDLDEPSFAINASYVESLSLFFVSPFGVRSTKKGSCKKVVKKGLFLVKKRERGYLKFSATAPVPFFFLSCLDLTNDDEQPSTVLRVERFFNFMLKRFPCM
jgi:hypothetical protein